MNAAVDSRRLRRNFSSNAARYDRHAQVQRQVVAHLLDLMSPRCPQQGSFVEVGSGTGRLAQGLCQRHGALRPIVTDIAHGMTLQARDRLPAAQAVDAAAEALPFADGSVALVCSSSVYQWVVDLPQAFAESARILADGGLFAFALFGKRTLWELKAAYRSAAAKHGSGAPHLHELPELATVEEALSKAGFREVDLQRQELVEYHADAGSLLRSLKQIGAGNASGMAPRGLASRRLLQDMAASYRQRFGRDDRIPATYEVVYGLALRPPRSIAGNRQVT